MIPLDLLAQIRTIIPDHPALHLPSDTDDDDTAVASLEAKISALDESLLEQIGLHQNSLKQLQSYTNIHANISLLQQQLNNIHADSLEAGMCLSLTNRTDSA